MNAPALNPGGRIDTVQRCSAHQTYRSRHLPRLRCVITRVVRKVTG